jgi:hypothetical protein
MAIIGNIGGSVMQPNQLVEGEYTEENYKEMLRWIGLQYNQASNSIPINAAGLPQPSGYINEYLENLTYIYGAQTPSNYSFFIKDAVGNNTAAPLFRGLDVFKIFSYLHGEAVDLIEPLPKILNATAYSIGAISAKKEMMDFVKFQIEQKTFLEMLKIEAGFGFKAIDRDFQSKEEEEKFFTNAQDEMELAFNRICKHACYYNNYQVKLPKAFDNMVIGSLAMACVEYDRGQINWRIVQPENAVVDYSKGFDVHLDDDFAGEVYQVPVTEVLAKYQWTEKEIEELQAISQNQSGLYNAAYTDYATNNLYWFNAQDNGVPKVTIIKGQWKSNERMDGVVKQVLREGDFIGGRWVKNNKISDGQITAKGDVSRKRLKYIVLTPNLFMGTTTSVVSIIKRVADLRDAFLTKVTQMTSTPIGKVAIIRASKLPTGLRTPDVIAQLKQAQVMVIEGEETEDEPNGARMAETLDLTLDQNIMAILQIAQYYEGMISDVLNIPNQVRGQIADYASKNQLQTSQVQSTKGLAYLYKNYLLFEKELLSYSADLMKLLAPQDPLGIENLSLIVGDSAVEMLSMDIVKRMQFEDFLINLNVNDYLSEAKKARLTELIGQISTSGAPITVLESYIAAEQAETLTELRNYVESSIYKTQKREDEQIAQQQEMQMAQAELNAQTQQQMVQQQTGATLEKAEMDNETKLAAAAMSKNNQQK